MNSEFLPQVVGALTSLVAAFIGYLIARQGHRLSKSRAERSVVPYRARMERLSDELRRASTQIDATLEEMQAVAQERGRGISALEGRLQSLTQHEKELQSRVETLKQVPLEAVEYFLDATAKSERRSASRDYILFGSGVVVSTLITVVLKVVFGI